MKKEQYVLFGKVLALLLVAAISFFVLADLTSRPDTFGKTISHLDDKKTTVAEMAATATAASVAITLIPGDAGTPIAEKLVDLTGYFVVIFAAIYVEKFLTTVTGYLAFRFLIPIACLLLLGNLFLKRTEIYRFSVRLIVFGLVLFLLVPASVSISTLIERTHEYSVQTTLDNAREATEEIEKNAEYDQANPLETFLGKVTGGVSGQLEKFESILSNFIDTIALLIVTTCVIPICVLLALLAAVRQFFGIIGSGASDLMTLRSLSKGFRHR